MIIGILILITTNILFAMQKTVPIYVGSIWTYTTVPIILIIIIAYRWYLVYRARQYMIKEVVSGNTRRAAKDQRNPMRCEERSEALPIHHDSQVTHGEQLLESEVPEIQIL